MLAMSELPEVESLDHLALSVTDVAATTTGWALITLVSPAIRGRSPRLDELQYAYGPVEDVDYVWAVKARDPDNIAIEFFCQECDQSSGN